MTFLLVSVLAALSIYTPPAAIPLQDADRWAPLRFLLGTWEGTSTGQPGDGKVRREYRLVLRDQFIEVRNTTTYAPQAKNPKGETHEDVGYISYDRSRKTFVLRQFHVEGFINTYVSQIDSSGSVVFTSESIENIPPGWRARETYRRAGDDEIVEVFELAQAGKEFTVYSESRLRRVRPAPALAAEMLERNLRDDAAGALRVQDDSKFVTRNGVAVFAPYEYQIVRSDESNPGLPDEIARGGIQPRTNRQRQESAEDRRYPEYTAFGAGGPPEGNGSRRTSKRSSSSPYIVILPTIAA